MQGEQDLFCQRHQNSTFSRNLRPHLHITSDVVHTTGTMVKRTEPGTTTHQTPWQVPRTKPFSVQTSLIKPSLLHRQLALHGQATGDEMQESQEGPYLPALQALMLQCHSEEDRSDPDPPSSASRNLPLCPGQAGRGDYVRLLKSPGNLVSLPARTWIWVGS